jgi:iron complex outermembrane receptor protein
MSKVNSRWRLCTSALAGSLSLGFWAHPALAQSQTYALNAEAASNEGAARTESTALEMVIVTAEKRQETSLNVPMGLTAVSGQQLERTQSFRMEDFVGTVPGLTLIQGVGGGSQLVLRGVTAGAADVNTGVAVYVDDTPLTPSSAYAIPTVAAPDLDAFDMTRIEVLKGPQGTLYGANALGGILKYVTNAPDPSGFSARMETGVSSVDNGGVGYDYHGMVNIPLASDLALRVVGFYNNYPGFIDDPARDLKDINGSQFKGGRASLLYQATADLSVRLNVLYQDRHVDDYGTASEDVKPVTLTPIYGNLTQERLFAQPVNQFTQIYNLTINWDAGFAKLLSTTSFSRSHTNALYDATPSFGPYTPLFFGSKYGITYPYTNGFNTITQEVRLASEGDGPLQWQVGGYYSHQVSEYSGQLFPYDLTTMTTLYNYPKTFASFSEPTRFIEKAAFANLDYYITPALDVALGGRYSQNHQTYTEFGAGLLFGANVYLHKQSSEGVFTYSGDVRWHFTPESMLYARVATGYEPGGPNATFPTSNLPNSYTSATTTNYEVGVKSSLLDHHLTVEIAAYQIDWHAIQLDVNIGGLNGIENAGTARSRGVEWNFAYIPISGLTLDFNGAYTSALFTHVLPGVVKGVGANVGDHLPFVPLWESSASAQYERTLFGDYSGFVGLNWRFTGVRGANFEAFGPRQRVPGFSIFDMRAGIEKPAWSAALYVKNLANKIGINYVRDGTLKNTLGPQDALVTQPRTVGLTLTANF